MIKSVHDFVIGAGFTSCPTRILIGLFINGQNKVKTPRVQLPDPKTHSEVACCNILTQKVNNHCSFFKIAFQSGNNKDLSSSLLLIN